MTFHISAFLFAGLIFFVTFLHQGKKVKALYSRENQKYNQLYFTKKQDKKTITHCQLTIYNGQLTKSSPYFCNHV